MKLRIQGILLAALVAITSSTLASTDPAESYAGQWALDMPVGVGWLDVRQENGYLDGDLLWRWGSVTPVHSMLLDGEALVFTRTREIVRKRDADGTPIRSHTVTDGFFLRREGDKLKGIAKIANSEGTGYDPIEIVATRLPPMPPKPNLKKVRFGDSITLFNGTDLSGWKVMNDHPRNGWKVIDGALVNIGPISRGVQDGGFANLRTEAEFEDFNLACEVNVPYNSNSGIYLRGLYEVQVQDSYGRETDSHNMGAIYSRITPSVSAEQRPNHWQTLDITLVDRHVTVILNGTTIIDNEPVHGITGGALSSDVTASGPIFLQGDHGPVAYRNIVIRPVR